MKVGNKYVNKQGKTYTVIGFWVKVVDKISSYKSMYDLLEKHPNSINSYWVTNKEEKGTHRCDQIIWLNSSDH